MKSSTHAMAATGVLISCCAYVVLALFAASGRAGEPAGPNGETKEDPRFTPTVTWLPEPFPVEDSAATCEAEMKAYTEQISGTGVTFDMVPIPGGEFLMGSPADEPKRKADEGPQHRVRIEPFWMGKYEVTWNEYALLADRLDFDRRRQQRRRPTQWDEAADAVTCDSMIIWDFMEEEKRDGRPATNMSQLGAKMYCKWLSAKTGRYYRLPTEAEWEYACRAGTATAYSFGDDPTELDDYGWYYDNCPDLPERVGLKRPNPWGLYDMHGNVAEWTIDQYLPDFYGRSTGEVLVAPLAAVQTTYPVVVRGGSWDDDPDKLRSAARRASDPDWSMQDPQIPRHRLAHTDALFVGFRVVRPLVLPEEEEAVLYDATGADWERFLEYERECQEDVSKPR